MADTGPTARIVVGVDGSQLPVDAGVGGREGAAVDASMGANLVRNETDLKGDGWPDHTQSRSLLQSR